MNFKDPSDRIFDENGNPQTRMVHLIVALVWASLVAILILYAMASQKGISFEESFLRDVRTQEMASIAWLGAGIGYLFARTILTYVPLHWRPGQRFAAAFILIGAATIGITAFIFALQFRAYFAQWHDDEWSKRYLFETVFTILSAMYQFLVLGLRLYIPIGLIALLLVSFKFAQRRI